MGIGTLKCCLMMAMAAVPLVGSAAPPIKPYLTGVHDGTSDTPFKAQYTSIFRDASKEVMYEVCNIGVGRLLFKWGTSGALSRARH